MSLLKKSDGSKKKKDDKNTQDTGDNEETNSFTSVKNSPFER